MVVTDTSARSAADTDERSRPQRGMTVTLAVAALSPVLIVAPAGCPPPVGRICVLNFVGTLLSEPSVRLLSMIFDVLAAGC